MRINHGKRGNPNGTVVSEADLYSLIQTSRKTGGYMAPSAATLVEEDPRPSM